MSSSAFDKSCAKETFKGPIGVNQSITKPVEARASTGFVIDWFTPMGPLNVSFAQDLSKADDDKTEFFQFNLGTTF